MPPDIFPMYKSETIHFEDVVVPVKEIDLIFSVDKHHVPGAVSFPWHSWFENKIKISLWIMPDIVRHTKIRLSHTKYLSIGFEW